MAVGPNILILIRLVLYAILGMAVGSERNNVHEFIRNQQCFEVTVCALTLITMLTTIALVFLENVQFVKEHLNYWFCLNTFYFSKLTTDLLQQSLCSIMYVSIIYYRTSQPRDATCYFKVLTICVLTSLVLQSNGRLITFLWMCAVTMMLRRLLSHADLGILVGMFGTCNDAFKFVDNSMYISVTFIPLMLFVFMTTINAVIEEEAECRKVRLNYWKTLKSIYFKQMMAKLLLQSLCTAVYLSIVYFMSSQPMDATCYFMVLTMCVLTSLVVQSHGLLVVYTGGRRYIICYGATLFVFLVLFFGFEYKNLYRDYVTPFQTYMQWLPYINYLDYGFEGVMVSIYGHGRCTNWNSPFKNSKEFLESMGMNEANYWIDAATLIVFLLLSHFLTYSVLQRKRHSVC